MLPVATEEATAASRSSPKLPATEGEKMGSLGSVAVTVVTEPARVLGLKGVREFNDCTCKFMWLATVCV